MKIWTHPSSLGMIKPSLLLSPLTLHSEKVTHLCLIKEKKKKSQGFLKIRTEEVSRNVSFVPLLSKPENQNIPVPQTAALQEPCSAVALWAWPSVLSCHGVRGGRGTVLQQGLSDVISHKPLNRDRAQDGSVLYVLLLQIYAIRQLSSIEYAQLHRDHRG